MPLLLAFPYPNLTVMISPSEYESCTVTFFFLSIILFLDVFKIWTIRKGNLNGFNINGWLQRHFRTNGETSKHKTEGLHLKEQKKKPWADAWSDVELTISYERRDRRGFRGVEWGSVVETFHSLVLAFLVLRAPSIWSLPGFSWLAKQGLWLQWKWSSPWLGFHQWHWGLLYYLHRSEEARAHCWNSCWWGTVGCCMKTDHQGLAEMSVGVKWKGKKCHQGGSRKASQ